MYCLFIWSARLPFDMGYISIFTCLSLTIERWIAVVKPYTYRSVKAKHAAMALIFVWILGIGVNGTTFFRIDYVPDDHSCRWKPIAFAREELPWIDFTVQSIIPFTTMIALYAHIYFRMKNRPQIPSNRSSQLKKVTILALMACSALIIGWLPGRVTFMLTKFGYLHPLDIIHISCVMITFSNSCVNPWLYGMYSPKFRDECKIVFNNILRLCNTQRSSSSASRCFRVQPHGSLV